MTNGDEVEAALRAVLAPPDRAVDTGFATQVARLVALDQRLDAARRASRRRTLLGVIGVFTAAGALWILATAPAIGALVSGAAAGPAALLLMLLFLAAASPALTER